MKQIAAILNLAFAHRRNQGQASLFFVPMLLLLVAAIFSALFFALPRSPVRLEYALAPLGVAGAVLIVYWWILFLSTAASLCSPSALQLTPRLRISILFAAATMWLSLSLLILSFFVHAAIFCALVWALVLGVLFDARRVTRYLAWVTGTWIVYSTVFAALMPEIVAYYFGFTGSQFGIVILVWAVTAFVLGLIAITTMFSVINIFVWCVLIAIFSVPTINAFLLSYLRVVDFASWTLLFSLFAFGSFALMLFGMSGTRGDRLAAVYRKQMVWREIATRSGNFATRRHSAAGPGKWPGYTSLLNRAMQRKESGAQLVGYLFGPNSFWANYFYLAIFGCICILLIRFFSGPAKVPTFVAAISFIIPVLPIPAWLLLPSIVCRTRREQGLLSLSPMWPNRVSLNQSLGRFVVFQLFAGWVSCLVLLATFALAYQLPFDTLLVPALSSLISALIVCAYAMMDYASVEQPLLLERWVTSCAAFVTYGSLVLLVALKGPALIVATSLAVVSLLVVVIRWRRLIGGAAVLPVGRFAG